MRKLLAVMMLCAALSGMSARLSVVEDSVRRALSEARDGRDSLRLMCDLVDLTQVQNVTKGVADSIAGATQALAHRLGERSTEIEMLRNRANIYSRNVDSLESFLAQARGFAISPERDELVALIKMMQNSNFARRARDAEDRAKLADALNKGLNDTMTIYDKIVTLHGVCVNVAKLSRGKMLKDYEAQLGELVDSLPDNLRSVKMMHYVQAGLDMLEAGDREAVIAIDRKILESIDSLEAYYRSHGRRFRQFDANRYVFYTRMLGGWHYLSDEEFDSIYAKAIDIAHSNPRASWTYSMMPIPDIHKAMKQGEYGKALPMLKKTLRTHDIKPVDRELLLKYAVEASRAMGDKSFELECLQEYTPIVEQRLRDNVDDKYQEVQLMFDVRERARLNAELKLVEADEANRRQMKMIIVGCVSIGLLLLLLGMVYVQFHRRLALSRRLAESNERLKQQAEALAESRQALEREHEKAKRSNEFKMNFMRNLSYELETPVDSIVTNARLVVDSVDGFVQAFAEKNMERIEVDCRRLKRTLNDLSQVYEFENDRVAVDKTTVDLVALVEASIDTMLPTAREKGVGIVFEAPDADVVVKTDGNRYQQIVINILNNSLSRTDSGDITVKLEARRGEVKLTVSDDGLPIEGEDCGETHGRGVWLSVSRMLATLIGGELYVDRGVHPRNSFVLVTR